MNILHYSLGLAPYRSGGLTKYSLDLMKEESKNNNVYLLFPGKMSFVGNKVKIRGYKVEDKIKIYELVNPLPVPLLNGINKPKVFMKACDKDIFRKFLLKNAIDTIHIHTFMGLYKELLEVARELDIKIVYTTHDYFGICPKANFIDYNGELCKEKNFEKCLECNKSAYNLTIIKIMQSPIYRFLKNKGLIAKIKFVLGKIKRSSEKTERINFNSSNISNVNDITNLRELDNYYREMFGYIDEFLFNSSIAKNIYNAYGIGRGDVIGITHSNIKDNRVSKKYDSEKLRITYLGPCKKYKGFNLLLEVMKSINCKYKPLIELNVYGDTVCSEEESNIKFHGIYKYSDLSNIFNKTDLLIVPSIWYETFGFITLEAYSYGVPVLTTTNVGSKDILHNDNGIITGASKEEIVLEIEKIINNREKLIELNKNINSDIFIYNISEHCSRVINKYKKSTEK